MHQTGRMPMVLLRIFAFFTLSVGFVPTYAHARNLCRDLILYDKSTSLLHEEILTRVNTYEKKGYLIRDQSASIEEFSCRVAQAFKFLEGADFNLARRPLYLLEDLKFLGIISIKRKPGESYNPILSFVADLVNAIKSAGFANLEYLSLDNFGIIEPRNILALAVEMNTKTRPDGWFEISLKTECKTDCEISLDGIPLEVTGLRLKGAKVNERVTFAFQGSQNRHEFVSVTKDLLKERLNRYISVHPKFMRWFKSVRSYGETLQGFWPAIALPPEPLHLQIAGIGFHGTYFKLSLIGQLDRILIFPGIKQNYPYLTPVIVSLSGKWGRILPGNVVVTDFME
jgi:hypothetical protein